MSTKHTPGPWTVRDIPTQSLYIGPSNDGGAPSVALVMARVNVSDDRLAADARLIASARSCWLRCKKRPARWTCITPTDGRIGLASAMRLHPSSPKQPERTHERNAPRLRMGKLRDEELEWSMQTHRIFNPEPEDQSDPAPGWPLWLCAVMFVAMVAFAAVAW